MTNRFEKCSTAELETLLQCMGTQMGSNFWGMNPDNTAHDDLHNLFADCPSPYGHTLREKIEHYVDTEEGQAHAKKVHGLTRWNVTGYHHERCYGGPEEGGWYYDHYSRMEDAHIAIFDDEDAAIRYAEFLNQGDADPVVARVADGEIPPHRIPARAPRYE